MWTCASILCLGAFVAMANGQKIPTPPSRYSVSGTIQLPYAEISEPFTAYVDAAGDKSVVSVYDGLDIVYQLGDSGSHGIIAKIVYETTEQYLNKRRCFQSNGTADSPTHFQPLLPRHPENFKFLRSEFHETGRIYDLFEYTFTQGMKTNTYRFTTLSTNGEFVPILFHYLGFNTLFGSHYDEYIVNYTSFTSYQGKEFPVDTFNPHSRIEDCTGFPGPGLSHSPSVFSRVHSMVEPETDEIDESFGDFKAKHGKVYTSDKEHFERSRIYRANHHYVESMNRRKLSFRLKLNHLADLTPVERKVMRGLKRSAESISPPGSKPFQAVNTVASIPKAYDWRIYGAVTPVKDQAICGSCWSFSTTGVIEGAYFLKENKQVLLSQQNLMDCTWGEGNNACDGGEQFRAFNWMLNKSGIALAEAYGPYLMADGRCKSPTRRVYISSYHHTKPSNESDLILALLEQPVAVNIDASHQSFGFYSQGVYYEPKCGNKSMQLDHAVLAVGFGTLDNEDYWIVKNSWSTHWGNDGYVLMSRKDNNCGVATDATLVHM